ncbi:MAG: DUF3332 domain-containing protein [Prevotella sp.]
MAKNFFKTTACMVAAMMMMTSCIGSYSLFNKLLSWNKGLSNKFVNELVFIVISPAYMVAGAADALVLNTIEFWSGTNPIAKAGHVEKVWGQDGRQYLVKTTKKGYEVTKPTGEIVIFEHNEKEDSWSMIVNGEVQEIFRFTEDGKALVTLPDGEKMDVSLDEAGIYNLRMAVNDGIYFAAR